MVLLYVCVTIGEVQPSGGVYSVGGVQSTPGPLSGEETRVLYIQGRQRKVRHMTH